jgi:hypothetical protein
MEPAPRPRRGSLRRARLPEAGAPPRLDGMRERRRSASDGRRQGPEAALRQWYLSLRDEHAEFVLEGTTACAALRRPLRRRVSIQPDPSACSRQLMGPCSRSPAIAGSARCLFASSSRRRSTLPGFEIHVDRAGGRPGTRNGSAGARRDPRAALPGTSTSPGPRERSLRMFGAPAISTGAPKAGSRRAPRRVARPRNRSVFLKPARPGRSSGRRIHAVRFQRIDDVETYVFVPEGEHDCRVADVREGTSRDDSVRWSFRLEVLGGSTRAGRHRTPTWSSAGSTA